MSDRKCCFCDRTEDFNLSIMPCKLCKDPHCERCHYHACLGEWPVPSIPKHLTTEVNPPHLKAGEFAEYRKKTTILAKRMDIDFEVQTLEGLMKGKAGDYLAIGVNGEFYPIAADIMVKSYEATGRYQFTKYCEKGGEHKPESVDNPFGTVFQCKKCKAMWRP